MTAGKPHGRWALLIAMTLALPACQMIGIGCTEAVMSAQPATFDADSQEVVFTATLTDGDGQPISGAEVGVVPQYRQGEATVSGGFALAAPVTDDGGAVMARVPLQELRHQAKFSGQLQPEWLASFLSEGDIDGEFYCDAKDRAEVPREVVELVNDERG